MHFFAKRDGNSTQKKSLACKNFIAKRSRSGLIQSTSFLEPRICCKRFRDWACPGQSPPVAAARERNSLKLLGLGKDIPVITRDDVQRAKPDPDLFLAAARKLGTDLENCVAVGDSS